MVECKRCLLTDDITTIKNGVCEFCCIHDQMESESKKTDFDNIIKKIKQRKGFQVLMGLSGMDSCYLLHLAISWGLKPLVVHFDNGYNNPIAERNMERMVEKLGVTFIRYSLPRAEYDALNDAFIGAGVPEADIPNDMAMSAIMMDLADKYKIKYILNGHDFRNEGSIPLAWTYMDAKYIQSVFRWAYGRELKHFPLLTFKKQLIYALKGIKQIRPYNYLPTDDDYKRKILKEYGLEDYGVKHGENLYTEWVGYKYLPENFGIDKRIIYLSAQIRSGKITKAEAKEKLKTKHLVNHEFNTFKGVKRTRHNFETYNFKKYKLLLWALAKLKLVPWLFYKKYT